MGISFETPLALLLLALGTLVVWLDRVAYHDVEREDAVPFRAIAQDVARFYLCELMQDMKQEMGGG